MLSRASSVKFSENSEGTLLPKHCYAKMVKLLLRLRTHAKFVVETNLAVVNLSSFARQGNVVGKQYFRNTV